MPMSSKPGKLLVELEFKRLGSTFKPGMTKTYMAKVGKKVTVDRHMEDPGKYVVYASYSRTGAEVATVAGEDLHKIVDFN